jgi:hypothetical protein
MEDDGQSRALIDRSVCMVKSNLPKFVAKVNSGVITGSATAFHPCRA